MFEIFEEYYIDGKLQTIKEGGFKTKQEAAEAACKILPFCLHQKKELKRFGVTQFVFHGVIRTVKIRESVIE